MHNIDQHALRVEHALGSSIPPASTYVTLATCSATVVDELRHITAVLVTHRMHSVKRADRIVVLDHGPVVEQGTHSELMHRRGHYHELFSMQALAFAADPSTQEPA